MQIKIKRNNMAILISFDTDAEKFESAYERNKFFSELHGRKQVVVKQGHRYEYRREGLLDMIPNMRVDNSVFVVMREHVKMMEKFFNEWEDKVIFKSFPIILSHRDMGEMRAQEKEIEEKDVEVE